MSKRQIDITERILMRQRRHVTAMFVDLVESTTRARQLGEEGMMHLSFAYQDAVVDCAERYGGAVTRVVGDGILLLFGWPAARFDDCERALRAALDVHEAMAALAREKGLPVQCRIGIATGWVVVTDLRIGKLEQQGVLFGLTANLGARLQEFADPEETVICSDTHRATKDSFEFDPCPELRLKGFEETVDAWRLKVARPSQTRTSDSAAVSSDLVGRREEMEHLIICWERSAAGAGQVVLVSGEAGIGKSHLLAAQRNHPALRNPRRFYYQCSRFLMHTAFHPFVQLLQHQNGLRAEDPPEHRQMVVKEAFSGFLDERQLALLTALMVETEEGEKLLASLAHRSEELFREKVLEINIAILREFSRDRPLLLHFEDTQWIDPSSRMVLEGTATAVKDMPVMLVITSQSESLDLKIDGPHVSRADLALLSGDESVRMIKGLPGGAELSDKTVHELVRDAGGLPIYLAEATAIAVEGGTPSARWEGRSNNDTRSTRLEAMLAERVDSLGPNREMALIASAIGQDIDAGILAAAAESDEARAQSVLEALHRAGILDRTKSAGNPYRFRHALVQKTAYGRLVSDERLDLHRRIAEFLTANGHARRPVEPEVLAWHLQNAGDPEAATDHWTRAAERSLKRFAYEDAVDHAGRGLDQVKQLSGAQRDRAELRLRLLVGSAGRAHFSFGAIDTTDAFERALALAEDLEDDRAYLKAAQGLFTAHQSYANYEKAAEYGRRIANKLSGPLARATGQHMVGVSRTWLGEFPEALTELDEAIEALDSVPDEGRAALAAAMLRTQIDASRAVVLAFMGRGDEAAATAEAAVVDATRAGTPLAIANARLMACNTYQILRHPNAAENAQALHDFARTQRAEFYESGALSFIAVAKYQNGDPAEGYRELDEAWGHYKRQAARANQVFVCAERARGALMTKAYVEGLDAIADGFELSDRFNEKNFVAELYRLKAELLDALGDNEGRAIGLLQQARVSANRQGALLFELRAATALAQRALEGRTGAEEIKNLVLLCEEFKEGETCDDLMRARALLDRTRKGTGQPDDARHSGHF